MPTVTLLTSVFCLIVGAAVLWANWRRFPNQVFAFSSAVIALWLAFVYQAMKTGIMLGAGHPVNPIPWYQANAAVVAVLPAVTWLLKESIVTSEAGRKQALVRSLPWFGLGASASLLCFSDSFILGRDPSGVFIRGAAYYLFNLLAVFGFTVSILEGWREMRGQTGIRRIELQFVVFVFGVSYILLALLNVAGNYFHIRTLNRASIPVVLLCYLITTWGVTFHRIFDARQVFINLSQRAALALVLGLGILGSWRLTETWLPSAVALVASIALWSSFAFWLDQRSRAWLQLGGEAELAGLRSAVIAIARHEPNPDQLIPKFEALLRTRCQTPLAVLLFERDKIFGTGDVTLATDRPGHAVLCESGWATPENLQRRRPTAGVTDLREFVAQHSLGLIMAAPRGSPAPSFLVALGTKTTRSPFTYPEVERWQTIAELMHNLLTHSRLTAQAALEAKMAHLAMMSRGLAHDLKNLLTPISSFLVHTDGRFESGSAEAEVHGNAKRSVRLMTDYVREALFFSSRLKPNFEEIDVARVFAAVREVCAARAAQREVAIALQSGGPQRLMADAVLLQRMLVNLVNNAVDASAPGKTITLRWGEIASGHVRFEVVDDGCGIPAENLGRIFEPYFTTKQFGDEVRGFGLGLTICEKIVNLHQGSIVVRSEPRRGTNVTVDLPATPSTFARLHAPAATS